MNAITPSVDPQFFALQEALAGTYSLDMELGRGGMGVVYLARDVRLDRPVALKVLPEHLTRRVDLRERFLREARTAAKLSHPNIVPIHSVDEVGDFVFFAMAYIDGETLGERIRRRGPVAPSICLQILREVGLALGYAHSQGVIHRDVKPDNILMEEGSGRALVADFGIAGIMDESQRTGAGEIVGTVEFMSPEQAAGTGVDHRSDLYSLGMVAYYALSGQLPFDPGSGDVTDALQRIQSTPVPPVRTVAKTAPRRLARIVDTCLQTDPEERYDSAGALVDAVEVVAAARKQVPMAVRTFLYDPIDLGGDAPAYFTIGALAVLPSLAAIAEEPALAFVLIVYAATLLGLPTVLIPPRIRRLLASGNTIADLELGLLQDLEQRREEAPHAPEGLFARLQSWVRKASVGSMGASWALFWLIVLISDVRMSDVTGLRIPLNHILTYLAGLGGLSFAGFVVGSLGAGRDKELAALKKAERRLRFWQSRIGRALFKVSGMGLSPQATQLRATHRPTELQIGLAAEGLFRALPKEIRKSLGDVPAVVLRLEKDAHQLRESIERLNDAQAAGLPRRVSLPADLVETRERAEQELSDVVVALETIRLELLRLSTGSGSVEGLTANLLEAGEVGANVERMMAGIQEVEALLESTDQPEVTVP